jgi:hypothetical protein
MDIICARCGRHFNSVEAAREHKGECNESAGGRIHWIPAPKSKLSQAEWESLLKLVNQPSKSSVTVPPNTKTNNTTPVSPKESATANSVTSSTDSANTKGNPSDKQTNEGRKDKSSPFQAQKWLIALVLIFACSIVGLAISILVGSPIPFWIAFGFSTIFSIEKWFGYITRKYQKGIGNLYRLLLNLSILSLLGLLIWSGVKLFSHQFVLSPLA